MGKGDICDLVAKPSKGRKRKTQATKDEIKMALPPPNQTAQQAQQYSNFSTKEAIGTAIRAGFLQFQANQIAKSSFLKMIPGAGIIRERAELKKRELYEKTGRDEQGRKLTKQELDERERARKDKGKLAEIHDIIQSWNDKWGSNDEGVAVYFKKDSDILFLFESMEAHIKLIHGFLTGAGSVGTATYGSNQNLSLDDVPDRNTRGDQLEAEELAQEQEQEDDEDQVESEGRMQKFFTKLFGSLGQGRNREEGSSILGMLSNMLSPLLRGGSSILGFMKGLVTPILSILGTVMTSVMGFITPLLTAALPLLVAAAPILVAGLIGGAAGLAIANWVTGMSKEEQEKSMAQSKEIMERGVAKKTATTAEGEKLYRVSDKDGQSKFATAKELNLNEEQLKQLETGDFVKTDSGTITQATYNVETQGGKETGRLAENLGADEILAAEITGGKKTVGEANAMDQGQKKLMEIERKMAEYSSSFSNKVATAKDNSIQTLALADDFNRITNDLDQATRKYPDIFNKEKMVELTQKKYRLFRGIYLNGKVQKNEKAYIDKDEGFLGGAWDEMDKDDLVIPGVGEFEIGSTDSRLAGNEDSNKSSMSITGTDVAAPDRTAPASTSPLEPTITPPPPSGAAIPATSNENAALQSAPSSSVSVNSNTSNVNQSNNAVIASGVSARVERTGIDNPMWNGYLATG